MEGGIEITRLLLGVAKHKEYNASQHINSMCHECIKTTRSLLGVAKYKEYTNQHNKKKITRKTSDMGALSQHAYSWASRSTKSPKHHELLNGNMNKESHKTTRLLLGVAKYKEYTNQHIDSRCHECIKTTRLLPGVVKNKEF